MLTNRRNKLAPFYETIRSLLIDTVCLSSLFPFGFCFIDIFRLCYVFTCYTEHKDVVAPERKNCHVTPLTPHTTSVTTLKGSLFPLSPRSQGDCREQAFCWFFLTHYYCNTVSRAALIACANHFVRTSYFWHGFICRNDLWRVNCRYGNKRH